MSVYSICGLCLCGAVAIMVIKELKREFVPVIAAGIGLTVTLACLSKLSETVELLRDVSAYIDSAYAGTVLRALGIAYLTSIAAELSRSCGEQSVGSHIETAGKLEILVLSVPLFRELFEMALLK